MTRVRGDVKDAEEKKSKTKRNLATINVAPDAKELLEKALAENKIPEIGFGCALVLRWFAALDPTERALVLNQVDERDEAVVAFLVLRRARDRLSPDQMLAEFQKFDEELTAAEAVFGGRSG